ncbi:Ltp family lipoprotein [Fundicoccus sp. Sow4_H7]|uniref:Ltp family lipoprotein n=1 Tax=Fundicoccus sp. Sow4_H7 TaxID=3438784 RepID=UPI003F8E6BB8
MKKTALILLSLALGLTAVTAGAQSEAEALYISAKEQITQLAEELDASGASAYEKVSGITMLIDENIRSMSDSGLDPADIEQWTQELEQYTLEFIAPLTQVDSSTEETTESEVVEETVETETTDGESYAHLHSDDQAAALEQAKTYVAASDMSKRGLYRQLIYDFFSPEAAQYAVDTIEVDWQANAFAVIENYFANATDFSVDLIESSLEFLDFTEEEIQNVYNSYVE